MQTFRFSDDHGNETTWNTDGAGPASGAFGALSAFMDAHSSDDDQSFRIDNDETGEALILHRGTGVISRVQTRPQERIEYSFVGNSRNFKTHVSNFVLTGYAGLDRIGAWYSDTASLERARTRRLVEDSALRRTHPQELRRRLGILTAIDGNEVHVADGVTHYRYGNGAGDTVNAWFTSAGRGLLITFDHESDLNAYNDPETNAAYYDGVPDDLVALARDVPDSMTTLSADHPDGGTLVAATGVFHFSAPVTMSAGLVARLQETSLDIHETGLSFLVDSFLQIDDFNPDTVADTTAWWGHDDIAHGFATYAATDQHSTQTDLDPETEAKLVERFCESWERHGYNDPCGVHHILFDSHDRENVNEAELVDLLEIARKLGLERVEAPVGSASGELWFHVDSRIDAELEFYS
ncbi:MAG TPA: hypothetical protein H9902_01905 [Candidatus Stackebrandtia faecavium]|nr:hypothetical protein [Candidatus Stackebrandtia faecavium]